MNKLSILSCIFLLTFIKSMGQQQTDEKILDTLHYAFPLRDNKVYYERIVEAPGQTRDNLYKIVKSWGVSAFNSQKDILQADDKEGGIIAYKYFFKTIFKAPKVFGVEAVADWKYWQVMKIFLKDGKAKIVIDDVTLNDIGYSGFTIETFRSSTESYFKKSMMGKGYREKYYAETYRNFQRANTKINSLIDELEKALHSGKSEFDF